MQFKDYKKHLESYGFYGFTVKEDTNYHLSYTFHSIKWFRLEPIVRVKIDGTDRNVYAVDCNGKHFTSLEDFQHEILDNLVDIQRKLDRP